MPNSRHPTRRYSTPTGASPLASLRYAHPLRSLRSLKPLASLAWQCGEKARQGAKRLSRRKALRHRAARASPRNTRHGASTAATLGLFAP